MFILKNEKNEWCLGLSRGKSFVLKGKKKGKFKHCLTMKNSFDIDENYEDEK